MIALVSRWKLKNGCPAEMMAGLQELSASVKRDEPGTLLFSVNVPTGNPPIGPPPEYAVDKAVSDAEWKIAPDKQSEIVFFEVYRDAEAFGKHLSGPFADFLKTYRHFFQTPWQGHPRPETIYLDPKLCYVNATLEVN